MKAKSASKAKAVAKAERPINLNLQLSPEAQFFADISGQELATAAELKDILKTMATMSKEHYFDNPIAFPHNLSKALKDYLTRDFTKDSKSDLIVRGDIIKLLRHHIENQGKYAYEINPGVAEAWLRASARIQQLRALVSARYTSLIPFTQGDIDFILSACNHAASEYGVHKSLVELSVAAKPFVRSEEREAIIEKFNKKHPKLSPEQQAALRATAYELPITISKPAKDFGITKCDQSLGIIRVGRTTDYKIRSNAIVSWLVIRLLVEAKDGKAVLFNGWAGTFCGEPKTSEKAKEEKVPGARDFKQFIRLANDMARPKCCYALKVPPKKA